MIANAIFYSVCLLVSVDLFEKLNESLMTASISKFYHVTPTELIISTVENDLNQIDNVMPQNQSKLLSFAMKAQVKLAISAYSIIYILAALPLAFPISIYYLKKYLNAFAQTSKAEKVTFRTLNSQFKEGIDGRQTIRAYSTQNDFIDKFYKQQN